MEYVTFYKPVNILVAVLPGVVKLKYLYLYICAVPVLVYMSVLYKGILSDGKISISYIVSISECINLWDKIWFSISIVVATTYCNYCTCIFQTTFVDCLVSQTHPEIDVKDDKDVSYHTD